jgi:hypothetical protein
MRATLTLSRWPSPSRWLRVSALDFRSVAELGTGDPPSPSVDTEGQCRVTVRCEDHQVGLGGDAYGEAENAERAEKAKARGPRPRNRVIFDVKATISPDAEGTYEAFKKRYHPPKRMYPTRIGIDGQDLWMWVVYTVRGGHPADIRRALDKCLADAGATLVGEPIIDVIEREKLPGPDSPAAT